MRPRGWVAAGLTAALLAAPGPITATMATSHAATDSSSSLCPPATPTAHPVAASAIRFGIDPGLAGNPLPTLKGPVPVDEAAERAALGALKPPHRALEIRLNRLFWSGGEQQLRAFAGRAASYGRQGYGVEVQVRYHPTSANNGNLTAWSQWVRHVVDVLGKVHALESLTITNEVNLAISPNTSDGSFKSAEG
ncbi:MAG: hypothetical protein ACTHK4_13520, partial [Mycobacteriales bacterium]